MANNSDVVVFSNIDNILLSRLLKDANPNPNPKVFPDFISDNVIIEHFSVTSSKEIEKVHFLKLNNIIIIKLIKNIWKNGNYIVLINLLEGILLLNM